MTIFIAPNQRRFHLFPISISRYERVQYLVDDFRARLQGLLTTLCIAFTAICMACRRKQALAPRDTPQHTAPFTYLPNDVLLNIVAFLPLADAVSLSMSCKRTATLLKHQRALITEAATGEQYRFLRRFDQQYPEWCLCKTCARYFRWTKDKVSTAHLCRTENENYRESCIWITPWLLLNDHVLTLVKRARYYRDRRYGLPLSILHRSFDWSYWKVTTRIVCTSELPSSYILRIKSTTPLIRGATKCLEPHIAASSIGTCRCLGSSTVLEIAQDALISLDVENAHGAGHGSCGKICKRNINPVWPVRRCELCNCRMQVRLQCAGQTHEMAIVRYHDLGPLMNVTSSIPSSDEDEEELNKVNYTRDGAGNGLRYLGEGDERDRCDAAEDTVRCPNDEEIWI